MTSKGRFWRFGFSSGESTGPGDFSFLGYATASASRRQSPHPSFCRRAGVRFRLPPNLRFRHASISRSEPLFSVTLQLQNFTGRKWST